ncbi:MAG: major capsid protein [Pseudomonadota bacterium]
MAHMNIFESDPFSTVTMTDALQRVDFQPTMIRSLINFTPVPIRNEFVSVEERDGTLSIIQTSERGAPPEKRGPTEKRKLRVFKTPRITKQDTITASEVQGIRAFGSETELMQVQAEVARRLNGPVGIMRDIEMTWEHMALGCINGVVLDADGSTIYDYFVEFEQATPAVVSFDMSASDGSLREACVNVAREVAVAGRGLIRPPAGDTPWLTALCSDAFIDALMKAPEVRETYLDTSRAQALLAGSAYGNSLTIGPIRFVNYRGSDDGATITIPDGDARLVPNNAPGIFQVAYSPFESFDYVNTPGLPVYSMIVPDPSGRNMFVDVEAYSYPLFMCRRPEVLRTLRAA